MKILIINGPNLNLLGTREVSIYGEKSFEGYLPILEKLFDEITLEYFQSNWEGEIIDKIQEADGQFSGIVLNAAAYTHTSVAIGDAVEAIGTQVIEVHITNIVAREEYRHISYISPYAKGIIAGLGLDVYKLAILHFINTEEEY